MSRENLCFLNNFAPVIAEFGPYQVVAILVTIWSPLFGWMLRLLGPAHCRLSEGKKGNRASVILQT
jgi:hypothetical protein